MMLATENNNTIKKKKKKKVKPRWLQLYEDSERRMTKAKQRQMRVKKASNEALNMLIKNNKK